MRPSICLPIDDRLAVHLFEDERIGKDFVGEVSYDGRPTGMIILVSRELASETRDFVIDYLRKAFG